MSSAGATYMTYATLVKDITNYIERGRTISADPTVYEQIPRLINAAERKIAQVLKLQGIIEVLNNPTGLVPGQSVLPKPDRWRETVSMSYGRGAGRNVRTPLFPRGYEYLRSYWPDDSIQDPENPPLFYADYNYKDAWLIAPTSDDTYPVEIIAYMQPPLLSETNQRNFFTDYTPNMLLYGTLLEATPFIKNDERIQTWQGYWELEAASLTKQDLQKILDRAAQRSRP